MHVSLINSIHNAWHHFNSLYLCNQFETQWEKQSYLLRFESPLPKVLSQYLEQRQFSASSFTDAALGT